MTERVEDELGTVYQDDPADPYEASDVVKFDPDEQGAFDRYDVHNVIELKGRMHIVIWVDRDKGLAGVMPTHPGEDLDE